MATGWVDSATDSQARFAEWAQPHWPAMLRFAIRLVGAGDAEDVAQEALVRAWQRWSTYDPSRGRPQTWLLRLVLDQASKHRRRERRHLGPARSPILAEGQEPSFSAASDDHLALEAAVHRLPRRQQVAVFLFYFVDMSVADVALTMGCAEGTVRASLFAARRRLHQELTGSGAT